MFNLNSNEEQLFYNMMLNEDFTRCVEVIKAELLSKLTYNDKIEKSRLVGAMDVVRAFEDAYNKVSKG